MFILVLSKHYFSVPSKKWNIHFQFEIIFMYLFFSYKSLSWSLVFFSFLGHVDVLPSCIMMTIIWPWLIDHNSRKQFGKFIWTLCSRSNYWFLHNWFVSGLKWVLCDELNVLCINLSGQFYIVGYNEIFNRIQWVDEAVCFLVGQIIRKQIWLNIVTLLLSCVIF